MPRIVILGAESTGTTTLAQALAAHYGTQWVPKYGREYCERLPDLFAHAWRTEEFAAIAREQNRREDLAARTAGTVLICGPPILTAPATGMLCRAVAPDRRGHS